MTNAQQIVEESNEDVTTAEEFKEWLESHSGSSEKTKISVKKPLLQPLFSGLPETSFKFEYKRDKQEDPLEELGIEVLR